MYYGLIFSHLNYSFVFWGNSGMLQIQTVLQKKAICVITNHCLVVSRKMFKAEKCLNLPCMYIMEVSVCRFKCCIEHNSDYQTYFTRKDGDLRLENIDLTSIRNYLLKP